MIKKTIFTGFAPNMTIEDVKTACSYLFSPLSWFQLRKGKYPKKVESWFKNYFNINYAITFDSGRSSLYFALKSLNIGKNDEVIVPGYTCVVVPNAVKYTGAKPVYVDIKKDLNIDTDLIEKKISKNTQAIILQHTFGKPADIQKIKEIATKNNIKIIEDCAHSLGAKYNNKNVGNFGDVSLFSFGSNKVISSVRGGVAITNNKEIGDKLKKYQNKLKEVKLTQVFKHLLYYPFFALGKKLYSIKLGKILLGAARKFGLLASIILPEEKEGKQTNIFPSKIPNSLANLAFNQLQKLDKLNRHRNNIANFYKENLDEKLQVKYNSEKGQIYLNFPILVNNQEKYFNLAKKHGFILGTDWSGSNIVPDDSKREEIYYNKGECPKAEKLSKKILLLPTNINTTISDAKKICKLINKIS